ncbi:hypothetical protein PZ938_02945 [Luteipulveratus sp. YIM 133132]|uniref:hypothetical protein n=1 Tax=Luteipulveratus flavus TaxID=3031728 RepID=UPI0023B19CC5|nr:hypothetical protein [Luteipulveratus sp. YIM 133132]MDE9364549.1 hypothetical protein [Luteipulveratus sp. YIM 133132]
MHKPEAQHNLPLDKPVDPPAITSVHATYQHGILIGLNATGQHIYAGTANPNKVRAARTRSRMAKASRRRNRGQR